MKRTIILSVFAISLIGASLGYFLWYRPQNASLEQKVSAQDKDVTPANSSSANVVVAPGYIEPISEEIEVGTEVPGKLRDVLVEEGDQVLKGQTIAVLENEDYEAAFRTAKTEIETLRGKQETAKASLSQEIAARERIANGSRPEERREAKESYELTLPTIEQARREVERRQRLFASGDISREEMERSERELKLAIKKSDELRARFNVVNAPARQDELRKADAAIELARASIREFDRQIDEANARIREVEARLTKTVIRAPITGMILRRRDKSGESVSPESPNGIVTIADTSTLRVRVDIDEADVAKIKEGQAAYVTADAYGEQKFTAKVVKIGQILGRKNVRTERPTEKVDTKILEVLLELEKGQNLPLGLRVDAFITTN